MRKVYYAYPLWEDHKHGMFQTTCNDESFMVTRCKRLLADQKELYKRMTYVAQNWKYSAEMNLSNRNRNRQAWLGQAACCYYAGAPEYVTKLAWRELTDEERAAANNTADRVIVEWEATYGGR